MLRGGNDDEEDDRSKVSRLIKRNDLTSIVSDFTKAALTLGKTTAVSAQNAAAAGQEDAGQEQVKTLKEVLEEREEQLKDIE